MNNYQHLRPLTEVEKKTVDRIREKGYLVGSGPEEVVFLRKDNFTISVVKYSDGSFRLGVSKRNPVDKYSKVRGEAIAFVRAISYPKQ